MSTASAPVSPPCGASMPAGATSDKIRNVDFEREKLASDLKHAQDDSARAREDSKVLRRRLDETSEDLAAERKKLAELGRSADGPHAEIIELQSKSSDLAEKLLIANGVIESKSIEIVSLREQVASTTEELADERDRVAHTQSELDAVCVKNQDLEDTNTEATKQNMLQSDRLEQLEEETNHQRAELEKVADELTQCRTDLDVMCAKAELADQLQNIDFGEFQNLMQSNLQVASTIQTLNVALNSTALAKQPTSTRGSAHSQNRTPEMTPIRNLSEALSSMLNVAAEE